MPPGARPIGTSEWERIAALTRFGRYRSAFQHQALEEAIALSGNEGTALDIGCGEGRWSVELGNRGLKVVCTDVNPGLLEVCQGRLPEASCVHVEATSDTLPMPDRSSRLILAYEVPPIIQAAWLPAEAVRVLEPGGTLVCTFHNPLSWRGAAVRANCALSTERAARAGVSYRGASYAHFRKALRSRGFRIAHERGITWIPLNSSSDSRVVDAFAALEGLLGLRRLPMVSPTVVLVAVLDAGA